MAIELNDTELWPAQMEKLFKDIMVEECIKGNMPDDVFKRSTWNKLVTELNVRVNRSFNHKQVKTKFNRLRTRHHIFSQLFEHIGMGWNLVTNTVTASEEVWQKVLAISFM